MEKGSVKMLVNTLTNPLTYDISCGNINLQEVSVMDKTVKDIVEKTVPLSYFNKGKAGQVFEDVKKHGAKVVMKNNEPEAVILSPKEYSKLVEDVEDYELEILAEERLKAHPDPKDWISQEEVYRQLGITEKDLEGWEDIELE